ALLELREATDAQAEAMAAQGATAGEVASFMAGARAQFVEAATAMGMSQEEATALADQLGLIPSEVSTRYEFTGPSPSQVKSEYDQRAAVIPDKEEVPIQFQASGTQAQAAVNSAMSKVVRPILKVRLQAENNVGVGYRRA